MVFKGEKHKNTRSQKNLAMFCVLLLVLKDFAGLSIALKGAFWGVTMQDSEHD